MYCFLHSGVMWADRCSVNFIFMNFLGFFVWGESRAAGKLPVNHREQKITLRLTAVFAAPRDTYSGEILRYIQTADPSVPHYPFRWFFKYCGTLIAVVYWATGAPDRGLFCLISEAEAPAAAIIVGEWRHGTSPHRGCFPVRGMTTHAS